MRLAKDGWAKNHVKVSSDLNLGREARHVDFAVDMAIAERAEVFIGNGVCGLNYVFEALFAETSVCLSSRV